jgi:hypothetical protein
MTAIKNATEEDIAIGNPEHYAYRVGEKANYGIEVMGMYGNPTAFFTDYSAVVGGDYNKFEVEPGWRGNAGGEVHLESDGTDLHVYSSMQTKPIEGGFLFKTAIHWPSKTPKALVEGHKLHYAIEFFEAFRWVAEHQ